MAKGISSEKIRVYPRGIDTERFHPAKRNGFYGRWQAAPGTTKLLYVGRVSKEKNLHLLVEAYRRLLGTDAGVTLTIVVDGPYLEEMRRETAGLPCIFTGRLEGEALTEAYASSDVFVFPSTTDTFGNVVLEAQASGLPVIVTGQGGPSENMLPGETGLVVNADCAEALYAVMRDLVTDAQRRRCMGQAARQYMERRSFRAAFDKIWELFGMVNTWKPAMA